MGNVLQDLDSVLPPDTDLMLNGLKAIAATLHALQPVRVPGFAFAWLELASHRSLMPRLLQVPSSMPHSG